MRRRFIERANGLRRWVAEQRARPVFRVLQAVAALAIVALSTWFIWKQLAAGYATFSASEITIAPHRLLLSWICIAAATALGAWEWTLLTNALGGRLELIPGLRIHLVSNLVKYVPGFIWPYVGKAYMAAEHGVRAGIAVWSIACEFVILYLSGGMVLVLCLPYSGLVPCPPALRPAFQAAMVLFTGAIIGGIPPVGRWLVNRIARTTSSSDTPRQVDWNQLAFVVIAVLLTWCLLGLGFSILSAATTRFTWSTWSRHTFVLASALLGGQLAVLVPMGLGVREAIFVALLPQGSSAALALVAGLAFRIEMLIGELLCASIAWLMEKTHAVDQNNPKG
jgi:hypothetical protein